MTEISDLILGMSLIGFFILGLILGKYIFLDE